MQKEKRDWGAALVLGEWGANPRNESSAAYMRASREIFNQYLMGEAFWLWKENCQGFWGLYDYIEEDDSWSFNEVAAKELGTPTVHAVPGVFKSLSFDYDAVRLTAEVETQESGWGQLFLPTRWYPEGPTVTLDGAVVEVSPLSHDRYEVLIPQGSHTLTVE